MLRFSLPLATALALAACAPAPIAAVRPAADAPALVGRAVFPGRALQATTADVAKKATVLLLDASSHATLAATVSGEDGTFSLAFPATFRPVAGTAYVLEAVRGLYDDASFGPAVRVRTLVRLEEGSWRSLTNAAAGGAIALTAGTTALAIAVATPGIVAGGPGVLFGTLTAGDAYQAPIDGMDPLAWAQLRDLVAGTLLTDRDPLAAISYVPGSGRWVTRDNAYLNRFDVADGPAFPGEEMRFTLGDAPAFGPVTVDFGFGPQPAARVPGTLEVVAMVPEAEVSSFWTTGLGGRTEYNTLELAPLLTVDFTDAATRDVVPDELVADAAGVKLAPSFAVDGGDGGDGTLDPGATTIGEDVELTSLTVAAGQTLTLTGSHRIRVQGDVDVAGTIVVAADAAGHGALTIEAGGAFTLAGSGSIRTVGQTDGRTLSLPSNFGSFNLTTGGAGNPLDLTSAGTMTLDGVVEARGGESTLSPPIGGSGGVVSLRAPHYVLGVAHRVAAPTGSTPESVGPFSPRLGTVRVGLVPDADLPEFETAGTSLGRFTPYATGGSYAVQTGAIDGGSDALPIVRWGRVIQPGYEIDGDTGGVSFTFQDSPDGTTWGPDWVGPEALPGLSGRFLRVRAALNTTFGDRTPLLKSLGIRHYARPASS